MRTKIIVILLVMASLFAAGCAGDEQPLEELEEPEPPEVPQENISQGPISDSTGPMEYAVRMEHYGAMRPSSIDIQVGDTIVWHNYKPQGSYTLVSEDGLFEDQELLYRRTFMYTFDEKGTYTFSEKDLPEMNVTVNVS